MSARRFVVRRGPVVVRCYPTPPGWTVAWVEAPGKRRRVRRSSRALAEKLAVEVATGLANGLGPMAPEDRASFARARELLAASGASLEVAAAEYAAARAALGPVPLGEAVRFYVARHPRGVSTKTVGEVVAEMVEAKQQDGLSRRHLQDLRSRLQRFACAFRCALSSVEAGAVEEWLRGLKVGPRSRNNYRRAVLTLASWAKSRRLLPADWAELAGIGPAKVPAVVPGVFRPGEVARLLEAAPAALVPYLALAAFAGLRQAELCRLSWEDVRLASGVVVVEAAKAKTAARRLVPIVENLAAWLAPHARPSGRVCPVSNVTNSLLRVALAAGVKWRHNGLRHSWVSYRLAVVQDAARVALEAGNSPGIIFRHYRELATPEEGAEWFAVRPAAPGVVVAMAAAK